MSIKLTRTSRGLHIGDSVSQLIGVASISPFFQVSQYIRGLFATPSAVPTSAPFVPPIYKWPTYGGFSGAAGRGTVTIAATAPAFVTFCSAYSGPFDFAVVQLGINDAANIHASVWTPTQVTNSTAFILDGLLSIYGIPYSRMMVVGPWQRPADLSVEVPQVVGIFQAAIAARTVAGVGPTFIDWSGISSAGANSIGDQTHPSAIGAALLAAAVQPGWTA